MYQILSKLFHAFGLQTSITAECSMRNVQCAVAGQRPLPWQPHDGTHVGHVMGCDHRRRTHRGNGAFAPVLSKVPGQTYLFAPVLFGPEFHLLYLVIRVWYAERNCAARCVNCKWRLMAQELTLCQLDKRLVCAPNPASGPGVY